MPMLSLADLHAHDPRPTRYGVNLRFCCPLPGCADKKVNQAHQSLSVQQQTGAYKCHRCQAAGVVREHQTRGQDEQGGASWRKQRAKKVFALAPPKPERENKEEWKRHLHSLLPLADTPGAAYLESRGIPPALATGVRFAPAWYGRPAMVFGLHTPPQAGRAPVLIAAQGRFVDGRDDPKTQSAGPISSGVFATPGAWHVARLFVCEAPLDALALHVAGFPALALCGTAWRSEIALAFAWRSIGLAFDADDAGDKAAQVWNAAFGPLGAQAQRVRPVRAKDWNALLMREGVAAVRACVAAQIAYSAGTLALEVSVESSAQLPDAASDAAPRPDPYADLLARARLGMLPPLAAPLALNAYTNVYDLNKAVVNFHARQDAPTLEKIAQLLQE